jgi:acyl-CoA reductase-like NAD-dependent aldehyde dehydrogenase
MARAAFGDDVVDHYVHAADIEIECLQPAVTDWERVREVSNDCEHHTVHDSTHDVINPATEEVVTTVDVVGVEETDAAIARAVEVGPTWRAVAPGRPWPMLCCDASPTWSRSTHRGTCPARGHERRAHDRQRALGGGQRRDVLRYYAAAPERLFGTQIPVAGGLDVTFKEPLGVVSVIVPWNFPMPIAGWGFAPALAAGNTVVLKPAELTPLTAIRLGELALEAGCPRGSSRSCPARVRSWASASSPTRRPQGLFTGSTAGRPGHHAQGAPTAQAGHPRARAASPRTSSSPTPTSRRRPPAHRCRFLDNAGQDCCARSRILVQRSVFDAVHGALRARRQGRRRRRPGDESRRDGPADQRGQRDSRGFRRGCVRGRVTRPDVAFRGTAPEGPGGGTRRRSSRPRLDERTRSGSEEIFGPVVAVMPFDDEADAIRQGERHGIRAVGVDLDPRRGPRDPRERAAVEAGNLSVNSHSSVRYSTPFGGFKASGIGREFGPDALDAFTETKNVFIDTENAPL